MFVDAASVRFETYDAFVAGSGFAGFAVAKRLTEHGKRVLILETGARAYDPDTQVTHSTVPGRGHFPGAHWSAHWIRALGGTSHIWGGYVAAMTPRNFRDWPISRADLDPYYGPANEILGGDGETFEHAETSLPGFRFQPLVATDPVRLGSDPDAYARDTGADILLEASLVNLLPSENRQRVEVFDFRKPDGTRTRARLQDHQVLVLAAGGVGNAQVLLNATAAGQPGVGNERDQVGRHLMEHPHFFGCGRIVAPPDLALPAPPRRFGDLVPVLAPNDQLHDAVLGRDLGIELQRVRPQPADKIERYLVDRIGEGAQVFSLNVRAEMAPDPENRLIRDGTRDATSQFRLRAECIVDAGTFRAVDWALEALGAALAARGSGRLQIRNEAIFHSTDGGGHIMGTTRMGSDPRTSVVDSDCRVHGYANLYVAGSSVFTTAGHANPTLTLIALALRLGDRLGRAA